MVDGLDPPRVAGRVEVLLGVCARGAAERVAPLGVLQQLGDRLGDRVDAVVRDEHAGLARDDDAAAGARPGRDDGDAARRRLDHRPAELGSLRRRDDDVGRLVEVRRVLRERDEAHDVVEPELVHEVLRLRLVVARQVDELERAADDGAEELLAADGAADDEVARVDAALAQPRGRLDELAEALRRIDEAEEGDDRQIGGQAERRARGVAVAGPEALEVDRVRDDRRADVEDLGDVAVDRDRRRRELANRAADERRPPVRPRSGSAERRCHTTGRPSRRARYAAGISGESLKWTSSNRWLRSVLPELARRGSAGARARGRRGASGVRGTSTPRCA